MVELEFRVLVFVEEGKLENRLEKNEQTQPTCGTGAESNPGHIGGRRALSVPGSQSSLARYR